MVQAHINCAVALLVNDRPAEARQEYEIALSSGHVPEKLEAKMVQLDHVISLAGGDSEPAPKTEPQMEVSSEEHLTHQGPGTVRISDR